MTITAVDLFCGVGGLTHGIQRTGVNVVGGIDIDFSCKFAFEHNNDSQFINKSIDDISSKEILNLYPEDSIKLLMGCAPCQPFSNYSRNKNKKNGIKDNKWDLLYSFAKMIKEVNPEIVSMENVPQLVKEEIFNDFLKTLMELNYYVAWKVVYAPDYGIAQNRSRLLLVASKLGRINIIDPTHSPENYTTVRSVIGHLPPLKDGEVSQTDNLHRASKLGEINQKRIRQSKPGGNWLDWDKDLLAKCHTKESGSTYKSVYGRMKWDEPSPTITTQFYGYGNGRFGHPEQHRAISLREGALLQSFPEEYKFIASNQKVHFKTIGRQIGNAVPVKLGEVIGLSIKKHMEE